MVMIGYEAGTKAYHAYNSVEKKLVVTRDVLFEKEKSWNWSSAEPAEPISDEMFHVVYADDQVAGSNVAADTDVTRSGDDVSSSCTEAGTLAGLARPRPGSPGKSLFLTLNL
jgi:hypothetical protein